MSDEKLDTVVASTVSLTGSSVPSGTLTVDSGAELKVSSGATSSVVGTKNVTGSVEYKTGSTLKIVPNAGASKVLTSSADGTATWQAAAGGSDWTYEYKASGPVALTSGDEGKWFYTDGTNVWYTLYASPNNGDRLAFSNTKGFSNVRIFINGTVSTPIDYAGGQISGGGSSFDSPANSSPLILIYDSTLTAWQTISGKGWSGGI